MSTIEITAYQALQKMFFETDEERNAARYRIFVQQDPSTVALSQHPAFPERSDYFEAGFFNLTGAKLGPTKLATAAEWTDFKNILAEKFAGRSVAAIFEEPTPGVFFELLYFKENGRNLMVGPKTSEKLRDDFKASYSQAETIGGAFFRIYATLLKAFDHSARSGVVTFSTTP